MRHAFVFTLSMLAAAPAHAFVCQRTSDAAGNANGPALTWGTRTIAYALNASGTAQIDPNASTNVLESAFMVWQNLTLDPNAQATCGNLPGTDVQFIQAPATNANWVGYNFLDPNNNVNLLVFRDASWINDPNATDVIALTTTTYSALTGEILDADIEFNSFQYQFVTTAPSDTQMDLLNTAVHEVGHFLGLAHCATSGSCGHAEVMEPTSNYGETQKRLLKCDDRAGMVFKYPTGAASQYCASPNATCGFCTAPPADITQVPKMTQTSMSTGRSNCQAGGGGASLASLLALAYGRMRRRKRQACVKRARTSRVAHGRGLLALALPLTLNTACGDTTVCDGTLGPSDPHAPRITAMRYLGSESLDPWRADIAADFVDIDGDVGPGVVNFYTGSAQAVSLSYRLAPIFAASGGVPDNATSGRIALRVRIAQDTASGAVLRLGTKLVDAAGHTSNCYGLDLSVDLKDGDMSAP